ncbi:MAG: metal ABC transporter substrate-binding protein [bacterium]|nr:metal ABC transporter substrate-binding protein [bacterium]
MNRLRCFVAVITIGVFSLSFAPLLQGEASRLAPTRLKVAATIFPLYDLVRHVAGPEDRVVLLVPPGASPHTFAARPRTIQRLAESIAVFAIGHGLDNWVVRLAQNAGVARTIVVDKQVALRPWNVSHDHAHAAGHRDRQAATDPHYWLAIPNAIRMVHDIAEALGSLNPAGQKGYRRRAAVYGEQLQTVHQNLRYRLSDVAQRNIATFHPAFAYLAAAYDLNVIATFEPSPGREPAPRQVERFLRLVRQHHLRVVLVEPQLPQRLLSSLARDLGVTLSILDPLGGVQGRDSYIAMMRFNVDRLVTALRE